MADLENTTKSKSTKSHHKASSGLTTFATPRSLPHFRPLLHFRSPPLRDASDLKTAKMHTKRGENTYKIAAGSPKGPSCSAWGDSLTTRRTRAGSFSSTYFTYTLD
eukprot:1181369-Prorocentrum_minimum.AAC.1